MTIKKLCVLDVSLTRKNNKNILKLRSDILEPALQGILGSPRALEGETAVKVVGIEREAVRAYRLTGDLRDSVGRVGDRLSNASMTSCFRGLSEQLINGGTEANISVLLLAGLSQGLTLEIPGLMTEESAVRWVNVAKNWVNALYNKHVRNWSVATSLTATITTEGDGGSQETPPLEPAPVHSSN